MRRVVFGVWATGWIDRALRARLPGKEIVFPVPFLSDRRVSAETQEENGPHFCFAAGLQGESPVRYSRNGKPGWRLAFASESLPIMGGKLWTADRQVALKSSKQLGRRSGTSFYLLSGTLAPFSYRPIQKNCSVARQYCPIGLLKNIICSKCALVCGIHQLIAVVLKNADV